MFNKHRSMGGRGTNQYSVKPHTMTKMEAEDYQNLVKVRDNLSSPATHDVTEPNDEKLAELVSERTRMKRQGLVTSEIDDQIKSLYPGPYSEALVRDEYGDAPLTYHASGKLDMHSDDIADCISQELGGEIKDYRLEAGIAGAMQAKDANHMDSSLESVMVGAYEKSVTRVESLAL